MTLPRTSRTVVLTGARRVEIQTRPVSAPGPGEILVRIEAATTCGTDLKVFLRGGHPRMLRVPSPFGHEMTGLVAAAGPGSRWREGDAVIIANSASCGSCVFCVAGRENLCEELEFLNGAFGEMILVPRRFAERSTWARPAGLPPEIAAMAEPLACVIHGLELVRCSAPFDAIVFGAGSLGLLFVHTLESLGNRVVLADPNLARLEVGRRLGATQAVTLERGSAPDLVSHSRDGRGFDLAVDATGTPEGWVSTVAAARPGGQALLFGGCAPGTTAPIDTHRVHYSEISLLGCFHHRPATFARAIELLATSLPEAGALLSGDVGLDGVEDALLAMNRREGLKYVVRPA